jgi:GNAT superfamily N-acetyltransferase
MTIIEVKTPQDWKLFHRTPHSIYARDPNWICPLEGDIQSIFDPSKNKAFEHGEAALFVMLDADGKPIARVAAFIDHERNKTQPYPVGGLGFFECVNNLILAREMLAHAEQWLKQRGAAAVDGPINFGERDKYWGLLDQGFDPPLFQENYQPRYYKPFFEDNGYIPFEQVLTMKGKTADIPFDRMKAVTERIKKTNDIHLETYDPAKLDQYAEDFCEIYNASFRHFQHFKPIEPVQMKRVMESAAPILDRDMLCIAYFEGKPAGFCAFFPDINPLIKPLKGKLSGVNVLRFLWNKFWAKEMLAKGIGFGIHPDYKTKGIFAFIVDFMAKPQVLAKYKDMFLTTVRAHNTEAVSIYLKLGVHVDRVHVAYRKALRDDVVVEPYAFLA